MKKLAGDGNALIPEKEIQLVFAASKEVGRRLTQVMQGMTRILDPSLIKGLIDDYRQKFMNQLQLADQAVKTSPPNLTEALNRILTAQSIIEDLLEDFESEREKQEEQYTFPLSTHIAIQQAFQKAFTEVPPEPSSNVTMATHKLESPPAYPYPETDKRFIGPHVEKGRRTEEGAEIIIMHFGPPTEPGRRILTDDGLVTVTKVFAEFELGAPMPNGTWHIMYKYGLHQ